MNYWVCQMAVGRKRCIEQPECPLYSQKAVKTGLMKQFALSFSFFLQFCCEKVKKKKYKRKAGWWGKVGGDRSEATRSDQALLLP